MRSIIDAAKNMDDNRAILSILIGVAVISLFISLLSHIVSGDVNLFVWVDGAFQNMGTEIIGAIVTFGLFDLVVGVRNEKKNLIMMMGSPDNTTALKAVAQMRTKGWEYDGSLKGAELARANLEGAYLRNARLPDSTSYLTDTNMEKFTDVEHPNFWKSGKE